MKIRTCGLVAVAAGMCLGLSGPGRTGSALAQPGDNGEQEQFDDDGLYNIYFDGGTLGEYFDLVADETGTNIVAGNDVRSLDMPPVRLRRVMADTAVHVVEAMFNDPGQQTVELEYINSGEEVSTFVANLRQDGPLAGSDVVNDVFSIGDVLRPADEEPVDAQVQRIFEMIASAMQLTGGEGDSEPNLAFHDETQMLVFRGTHEQQRMVESVLVRYNQSWRGPSERIRELREQISDVELTAQQAEIETRLAFEREQITNTELNQFEALVNSGSASSGELGQARLRASEVQAQHQIARARYDAMMRRLVQLKGELSSLTEGQGPTVVVYDFRDLGGRGDRIGDAFKALLDAAAIGDTAIEADGSGAVTLRAEPAFHEAMRLLLAKVRQQPAAAGRAQ